MAIKLEKVVQKFYDSLEEGKILGRKCPACGAVEFPPVYACNTCGNLETEWVEISGKGVMKSIVMPAALSSKPEYDALGARNFAYGEVELAEGAWSRASTRKSARKLWKRACCPSPSTRRSSSGMATRPWCSHWMRSNPPLSHTNIK